MRLTGCVSKCSSLILALLFWGRSGAVAGDALPPAAEYHSAGMGRLIGNSNLATLNKMLALPSAAPVRKLVFDKFSWWVANSFQLGTNGTSALLAPLLNDVTRSESAGCFGGATTNPPGFVVAFRLEEARTRFWKDSLDKAFGQPGESFQAGDFPGTRWERGSNSFWMIPAKGWLVIGRGDDLSRSRDGYLEQLRQHERPAPPLQDKWLEADLDWSKLAAWLPDWSRLFKPAHVQISVTPEKDNLRLTARVVYPGPVEWHAPAGSPPVELVRNPIVSFTAGQDVGAFLNLDSTFSRLDASPLTNQFFAWALNQMPLQTYTAWPAANASNALETFSTEAMAGFNLRLNQFNHTAWQWRNNPRRLVLLDLRVMSPTLEAERDATGEYLVLSMFPRMPGGQPAPDALWKAIAGRTNLVYYDWESTGSRLQEWRLLGSILASGSAVSSDDVFTAKVTEDKWLGDLRDVAGRTVTEITRVAPDELSVVRDAPVGLTGIEIFMLSNWLSAIGSSPVNPVAH
jgi:hypothetical protein